MCGIFGYVGDIARERAQVCIDTLAHRGPDGSGIWQTPGVTFGHRRLAILDLSDRAQQPMPSPGGRYWITFNGEVFNFLELRDELESRGHRFRSETDTEVVLAAFETWGEECQHRFNGMWALAIWDTVEQALFLSRDRFGEKPLFYAELPHQQFAFASEMKAIVPLLAEVSANVDLVRAPSRLLTYESTDECLIRGIRRFPAAHSGWVKHGRLQMKRWWSTLDHLPAVPRDYQAQTEQFRELFLDACRLRMRSDVPIGTALSGGLDSTATVCGVAHVAVHEHGRRTSGSWQHAFTAAFPGTHLEETEFAREAARHAGVDLTVIEVDPARAISSLDRYFYLIEDLYITSPIPFMQTYAAVKANGISVTLDGHGADELFGGYAGDYVHALTDAGWNLSKAADVLTAYYDAVEDTDRWNALESKPVFLAKWHGRRLLGALRGRRSPGRLGALDTLNSQLYRSTHDTVLPTLLRNFDRYSMSNGVEIRMPFMDHRIVSFAFALPWSSKVRQGRPKAIVRDALAPFMPRSVVERRNKVGFNSPIVDWMKGPLRALLSDTVASRDFKECRLVDPENAARAVDNVINNPAVTFSEGERTWTMVAPYFWERAVIKPGAAR